MKYTEVSFTMDDPGLLRDLLVDNLAQGPYESFMETKDGLKAYLPAHRFDPHFLEATVAAFPLPLKYVVEELDDRDWNAEWEKEHQAVLVKADNGTSIWVRAPFHPHRTDVDYELLIEPKMSFGTAHHPTTYMMLSYLAELDINRRRVLDMGCGTAVLAILAKMRGATLVEAIDIDEWAFRNAHENADSNNVDINLHLGNADSLAPLFSHTPPFDIIIANINRNILLADMDKYAAVLAPRGTLLLSGFYQADVPSLVARANQLALTLLDSKNRDGWCALRLQRR